VIGHLQVGIQLQRKNIYYKYRDLVYKYMGLLVEPVLEQACVRLVSTSVGRAGLGLEALVAGCLNGRMR